MFEKSPENQTLALAAAFQYCEQVFKIATTGQYDNNLLDNAIHSILQVESDTVEDIYGGFHQLLPGMTTLQRQLGGSSKGHNVEITRYFATLTRLERALMRDQGAFNDLRSGIETAISQAQYFDNTHENVISNIADIYKNKISNLGSKVIVNGEQRFLANEDMAKRIRVFLLAALRAIVLWKQAGGGQFSLILKRDRYIHIAKNFRA